MMLGSRLWSPRGWHHIWGFQAGVDHLLRGEGMDGGQVTEVGVAPDCLTHESEPL